MPILGMDHFTIFTANAAETVAFYGDILGLTPGPRPAFCSPALGSIATARPCCMSWERSSIPEGGGVLDDIAFSGKDAPAYLAKLKARGIKYDLRRLPEPGLAAGLWQLFFFDPSGDGRRSTSRRARASSRRPDPALARPIAFRSRLSRSTRGLPFTPHRRGSSSSVTTRNDEGRPSAAAKAAPSWRASAARSG